MNSSLSHEDVPLGQVEFIQLVKKSLRELAKNNHDFGNQSLATEQKLGESHFQHELHEELISQTNLGNDWQWFREIEYKTTSLINKGSIKVDIVGIYKKHFFYAIELKYVPKSPNGSTQDFPSFPYDLLKDALKIELLLNNTINAYEELTEASINTLKLKKQDFSKCRFVTGLSIGLTNEINYWANQRDYTGWAVNYLNVIQTSKFQQLIRSKFDRPFTTQSHHKRPHISFMDIWDIYWEDFNEVFRYVTISPKHEPTLYRHPELEDGCYFIPFLDESSRRKFQESKKRC